MADSKMSDFCWDAPKRLVYSDKMGLKIDKSTLDILKNINAKVTVVTIAGPYRTGKSYLMNRLAGQNTGKFVVCIHKSGSYIEYSLLCNVILSYATFHYKAYFPCEQFDARQIACVWKGENELFKLKF